MYSLSEKENDKDGRNIVKHKQFHGGPQMFILEDVSVLLVAYGPR